MHEIDFAFGPIEINMFMEYEFVGEDGKAEKTFVAMGTGLNDIFCLFRENAETIATIFLSFSLDMKSTKEKTRRLVKINWLEVLEAIVEVMGAFKRSADYGTANGKSVSYLASEKHGTFYGHEIFFSYFVWFFVFFGMFAVKI